MSIGDTLADARRQAGLTITEVSQRTRIRETIIRGIERGDFSACGGDFYARGHIRSIAEAVGADGEELIREYDAEHGAPHAIRAADVFQPSTPIRLKEGRRRPNWSLAMVLVLALVAGYGIYHLVSSSHSAAVQNTAAGATHSAAPRPAASSAPASPTAPATSAPPSSVVINLTAIEDCWVEFTQPNGTFISQAYVVAGSTRAWTFNQAVKMQIGNPGGIQLTVNGKKVGAGSGQPVTLSLGPGKPIPS